jgi:heme iron utilization protein
MGWVEAADYAAAAADPLAETGPGIISHMNADHADALLRIATHFAGESPDQAAMTSVDRLGFHLRMKSGERVHGKRVAFLREVRTSEGARKVLIEMVRMA